MLMTPPTGESSMPNGQLAGAMLVGLVRSLRNVQAISGRHAAEMVAGVKSDGWYPMSSFFGMLKEIEGFEVDLAPILFQAGASFVQDWVANVGMADVMTSAASFIRLQADNGGYAMVHRGALEEIGWLELHALDEAAGRATIVSFTPYPLEFERGLFYCGLLLCDDVDYAHVDSFEEPYNGHLTKKTIQIRYHRKAQGDVCDSLARYLSDLSRLPQVQRPANAERLLEPMAWRLKATEERLNQDRCFFEQSNLLLSRAADRIYELSQKLDWLAQHDELTHSLNRRAILERGKGILALAQRHQWPVAFIMLDVDHFKAINDTWGHSVGDQVLRAICQSLKNRLRESDVLGRFGGEEFLVILPHTDREGALELSEQLRAEVEQCMPLIAGPRRICVTISLGYAVAGSPAPEEIYNYIAQADQALYVSKREGRNRISAFAA